MFDFSKLLNPIFLLFNVIGLVYAFRGVKIVQQAIREWTQFTQDPLTKEKKSLVEQASFYVAIPPGVIVHELGHALATWLFGGVIVDFWFGFFWGYVVPVGNFTSQQDWFIALAGTLGTIIYGVVIWLVFRRSPAASLRCFGLRAFRLQLHFALIYYPIFTLFVPTISDWRIIYNFSATPLLSGITAVAHLSSLFLFFLADRRGWFEMAGFQNLATQTQYTDLKQQVSLNPADAQLTLQYIYKLEEGGARRKAVQHLKQFLKENPDYADGYALLAALQTGNSVSAKSKVNAEKALALGITNPRHKAMALNLLGQHALERNRSQTAVDYFSEAITAVNNALSKETNTIGLQSYLAQLYYQRGQAYRRQESYDLAYQDVEKARQLSETSGNHKQSKFYNNELALIQEHAGRQLGQ